VEEEFRSSPWTKTNAIANEINLEIDTQWQRTTKTIFGIGTKQKTAIRTAAQQRVVEREA
jgi:hypothetical protein